MAAHLLRPRTPFSAAGLLLSTSARCAQRTVAPIAAATGCRSPKYFVGGGSGVVVVGRAAPTFQRDFAFGPASRSYGSSTALSLGSARGGGGSRRGKGKGERKKKVRKRSKSRSIMGTDGSSGGGVRRFRGGGGGGGGDAGATPRSIDPDDFVAIPPDDEYDLNEFLGREDDSPSDYDGGGGGGARLYYYRLQDDRADDEDGLGGDGGKFGGDPTRFLGREGLAPRWTDPAARTSRHGAVREALREIRTREERRGKSGNASG